MDLGGWDKALAQKRGYLAPFRTVEIQRNIERFIVHHFIVKDNLFAYATGEVLLRQSGRIFSQYCMELPDVKINQSSDRIHPAHIKEIHDLGEIAINEFDKIKAMNIVFPNVIISESNFHGWRRANGYATGFNYHLLQNNFKENSKGFVLLDAGFTRKAPLVFRFGYDRSAEKKFLDIDYKAIHHF